MTKKEKKGIIILIIVAVLIIALLFIFGGKRNRQEGANNNQNQANIEEFVDVLDDGTKLNTSSKMKETKTVEGLEISDLQLTESNNVSLLLGTITNKTQTTLGGFVAEVKVVDKQGNEITTLHPYIGPLEPGKSTELTSSATFDYANAYDIIITKSK